MSIESRLTKLESAAGIVDWDTLRPEDTSVGEWEEIGALLRSLPDDHDHFHPHENFASMLADLACGTPRILDCPDAVLQASIQLRRQKLGRPFPTAGLWRQDEAADEALAAEIGERRERLAGGTDCSGNCSACEPDPANTGK
jgi:hypothetical protein